MFETYFKRCYINNRKSAVAQYDNNVNVILFFGNTLGFGNSELVETLRNSGVSMHSFNNAMPINSADEAGIIEAIPNAVVYFEGSPEYEAKAAAAVGTRSGSKKEETPNTTAPNSTASTAASAPAPTPTTPTEPTEPSEDPKIDFTESVTTALSDFGALASMIAPKVIEAVNTKALDVINKVAATRTCQEIHYVSSRGIYESTNKEITHELLQDITEDVEDNIGVYLYGPAGSGKSYIARQVANRLSLDYYEDTKIEQIFDVKGFIDAGGNYIETQFFKAYTFGGLYFVDEIDASLSEALTVLNNALANDGFPFPCGWRNKHPNFRLMAAGNTIGSGVGRDKYGIEYSGRNELDAATLNRLSTKILVDYDERIERAIAYPYVGAAVDNMLKFVHALREATAACGVQCLCTYREITTWSKKVQRGRSIESILKQSYGYLGTDNLTLLANNIKGSGAWFSAFRAIAA